MREHSYANCERHGTCRECAQVEAAAEARAEDRWGETRVEPYDTDGEGGYTWRELRS